MGIERVVAAGIIAAVLALTIKKYSPEIALLISLAAAVLIFTMAIPQIKTVFGILESISDKLTGDMAFMGTLLKITGIAYIAEFGAQICADAGEGSIASKIELAGKLLIMAASAPIITALMDLISVTLYL